MKNITLGDEADHVVAVHQPDGQHGRAPILYGADGGLLSSSGTGLEQRDGLSLKEFTHLWQTGAQVGSAGAAATAQNAYSKQAYVFACINRIATMCATARPVLKRFEDDDVISDDPFLTLLNRPAPRKSRWDLFYQSFAWPEMAGDTYWHLDYGNAGPRPGALPVRITPLNPFSTEVLVSGSDDEVLAYKYRNKRGQERLYEPTEIFHYHHFSPAAQHEGMGTLSPLLGAVRSDVNATAYTESLFKNSGRIDGVLIHKTALNPIQERQTRERIRDRHSGVDNAYGTMFLSGEWSYQALGSTLRDMDFSNLREFNRKQIAAGMNVPNILLNHEGELNRATAEAELRMFYDTNWGPKLIAFAAAIQSQIVSLYRSDAYFAFDPTDAPGVRDDVTETIDNVVKLCAQGVTLKAAIEYIGIDIEVDDAWAAEHLVPFSMTTARAVVEQSRAPIDEGEDEEGDEGEDDDEQSDDDDEEETPEADADDANDDEPVDGEEDERAVARRLRSSARPRTRRSAVPDQYRRMFWRFFVRRIVPLESQYIHDIRAYFYDLRSTVLANLANAGDPPPADERAGGGGRVIPYGDPHTRGVAEWIERILFRRDEANRNLIRLQRKHVERAMKAGGTMIYAELKVGESWSIKTPFSLSAFEERTNKIVGINDTLYKHVKASLAEGIKRGETIQELAQRTRTHGFNPAHSRARTIARTEVGTAVTMGRVAGMQEQHVEEHSWLSAGDDVVRNEEPYNHMIDGEVAVLGENFTNGLRWPYDDGGDNPDPANIINCRCTTIPEVTR